MSDLIPEGWNEYRQGDIADFSNGKAYKLTEWETSGAPVIRLQNLTGSGKNYYYSNLKLPERQYCESGDLLYMWSATFGPHIWKGQRAIYHYHIWKITCNETELTKAFLYQLLGYKTSEWLNQSNGMGILHITKGSMEDLRLTIPPLLEQQKIAAILTSVDEVIEKTQAQIDKLKDLKSGMMQELLTKGVGIKQGDKYVPNIEFKDSPVGRIPKNWEVSSLGELASFITSGSRGWAEYYSKSGAMFIRIGNLTREHINFRFKDVVHVTPPNSAEGKRTLVKTGDVLISITADLGIIAVVNDDLGEAYVNQHISLVRLNNPEISRWIGHFLSYENSQKQFTANNDSGAKAGLNLMSIRNTKVAIPPIEEMHQIVKTLDSLDSWIAIKQEKLSKVQDNKKALMQDLLTGKVRVKVDNDLVS